MFTEKSFQLSIEQEFELLRLHEEFASQPIEVVIEALLMRVREVMVADNLIRESMRRSILR